MAETARAIPRSLRRGCALPLIAALHVGRSGHREPPSRLSLVAALHAGRIGRTGATIALVAVLHADTEPAPPSSGVPTP
jgi:hypothetical protein